MFYSTTISRFSAFVVLPCVLPLLTAGCSADKFPVSPAKGKVVCGGQPVTVGSVSFIPMGDGSLETGKAALGAVGPDGNFVLTTFDRFDGAIVGKHRVQYNIPEADGSSEENEVELDPDAVISPARNRQLPKNKCVQKGEIIVEVKLKGDNNFTIELSPATSPAGRS